MTAWGLWLYGQIRNPESDLELNRHLDRQSGPIGDAVVPNTTPHSLFITGLPLTGGMCVGSGCGKVL